jgi:hypothetical protein
MKGRRVLVTFIAACATVCVMTPSVAQAANTTCVNADTVVLGQMGAYTIGAGGGATPSLYFKARLTAGRSYALMAWAPFQDAGEGGAFLAVDTFSDSACTTAAATVNGTDFEPDLTPTAHTGDADSIIPTVTGTYYIQVTNGVASAYTANFLAIETTLFSPWWFTGGTNQAYVEMRNNTSQTATGTLTFYSSTGVVCGTSAFTLSANGNSAVQINTVGTCASTVSGSAQLSFNGKPGGMVANITTLDVPNGTSFDAPFSPRMGWGTFTR